MIPATPPPMTVRFCIGACEVKRKLLIGYLPANGLDYIENRSYTNKVLLTSPANLFGRLFLNKDESLEHAIMANTSRREVERALTHARSKVALLVSPGASETPVARQVRHVRKEVVRGLVPDFVAGPTTAVLLLSLGQHLLKPGYIYERMNAMRGCAQFRLNVLLLVVDTTDPRRCHQLQTLCVLRSYTLLCCASDREAARYLECLRAYDGKSADGLRGAAADSEHPLTAVRGVNKTDAATLIYNFGSFREIAQASTNRLRDVPGLGDTKVARLHAALNMPFRATPRADKDVEPEREDDGAEIADVAQ